jgi:hypothetical protein
VHRQHARPVRHARQARPPPGPVGPAVAARRRVIHNADGHRTLPCVIGSENRHDGGMPLGDG